MIFNAKKKPLTIVSKSAARIAAVQIFYNTIISKRNISDVFQDYIISFKGDLENEFDIKSLNDNSENISSFFKKNKLVLIIDDINDTGKTFDFVKKTFNNSDCEIRFAALINNVTSKTKIDYHGQLIDKSESPVWYVFPWENWW